VVNSLGKTELRKYDIIALVPAYRGDSMESVRYFEFPSLLKGIVKSHTNVTIALRANTERIGDSNIVIHCGQIRLEWRVGPHGGRIRSDNWNIATQIGDVVCRYRGSFPDHIQRVYEQALNQTHSGWVVLTVENGRAMRAELRSTV
jgi:hypothetical protein